MTGHRRKQEVEWLINAAGQKIRFSETQKCWVDDRGRPVKSGAQEKAVPSSVKHEYQKSSAAAHASSSATEAPVEAFTRLSVVGQSKSSASAPFRDSRQLSGGVRHVTGYDPESGVRTNWEIGPSQRSRGLRTSATKKIRGGRDAKGDGGDDDNDSGGSEYKRSPNPRRDYRFGNVIEMLLVPPPADSLSVATAVASTVRCPPRYGTGMGRRRYVVLRPSTDDDPSFTALPIKIYGGQGVAAQGVIKAHHAVIYTREPVTMTSAEQPQRLQYGGLEKPMQAQPIRVVPNDITKPLDPMARLDFFDEHEFDADVPHTKVYGKVHERSRGALRYQWEAVRADVQRTAGLPQPAVGSTAEESASPEHVERMVQELHRRALDLNLPPIPALSDQQRLILARSAEARRTFVRNVNEIWRPTLLARLNTNHADDEEGSTEEDEDEDGDDAGENDG